MPDPPLGRAAVPGTPGWRRAPRAGVVAAFDGPRGVGEVTDQHGRRFPFHCTALVDGSRQVDEGTTVWFTVAPGHLGRLEADAVVPVPPPAP